MEDWEGLVYEPGHKGQNCPNYFSEIKKRPRDRGRQLKNKLKKLSKTNY